MAYPILKTILNRDLATEICSFMPDKKMVDSRYMKKLKLISFRMDGKDRDFWNFFVKNESFHFTSKTILKARLSELQFLLTEMAQLELDKFRLRYSRHRVQMNTRWREFRHESLRKMLRIADSMKHKFFTRKEVDLIFDNLLLFSGIIFREYFISLCDEEEAYDFVGLGNIPDKVMREARHSVDM